MPRLKTHTHTIELKKQKADSFPPRHLLNAKGSVSLPGDAISTCKTPPQSPTVYPCPVSLPLSLLAGRLAAALGLLLSLCMIPGILLCHYPYQMPLIKPFQSLFSQKTLPIVMVSLASHVSLIITRHQLHLTKLCPLRCRQTLVPPTPIPSFFSFPFSYPPL